MTLELRGKVALITGSSTGIGRAIAFALADAGAVVAINYRKTRTRAEETAAEVKRRGAKTLIARGDVTQTDQVAAIFKRVHGAFGRVDFLVNAAGSMIARAPFLDLTPEQWEETFAVNTRGTFLCAQFALRDMVKRGRGKIVNFSASPEPAGGSSTCIHVAAAKSAVDGLTRALASEYGHTGITINAVAPGVVDTPLHKKFTPPELFTRMAEATSQGRAASAEEVAALVTHLLSPAGDAINGQIIPIATGG